MSRLTLGQLATAVGAPKRWVLNALTRLGIQHRDYDERLARRLALAKQLTDALSVTLPRAFELAARALGEADPRKVWRLESPDGVVTLVVDLPRFYSLYLPRLSRALTQYGEKVRGRRPRRRGSALERAREHGVDTTLFEYTLSRTPAQRLAELDANAEFVRAARRSLR